jgi:hypothetical protein
MYNLLLIINLIRKIKDRLCKLQTRIFLAALLSVLTQDVQGEVMKGLNENTFSINSDLR